MAFSHFLSDSASLPDRECNFSSLLTYTRWFKIFIDFYIKPTTTFSIYAPSLSPIDIDVFLSHAWGSDAQGRWTHERLGKLTDALKDRGVTAWYNTGQLRNNMMTTACDAIDRASVVVVCLTEQYMKRANGDSDDRCRIEFLYTLHSQSAKTIIPMVRWLFDN